ncbi:MAG TPA: beta-ketoacyl synthase chain length factor [Mucilaginibacter sp.]|nr:beta-ketoacyl synthase chain length factor [Mucilaginibacter sp.]
MKVYIRSAACISPQKTFENSSFLDEVVEHTGNRLNCIEPDYHDIIDPKLTRRMSRVIKMSVASAFACLKQAGLDKPGAIVTGTAYGCLEDTGTFLTNMVEQDEEPLSPVAFVQSTHNTIGAQIALLLKCNGYNNTFVNGSISFENALLDAMMMLTENVDNILVGGMDEITDMSHAILIRTGLYKRTSISNFDLFKSTSKGTIGGEGASFFVLTNTTSENDLACIDAVSTFHKPGDMVETTRHIESFFEAQDINNTNIDLLILGNNGDAKNDEIYSQLKQSVFNGVASVNYKNLCGEYPVSTAFASWIGANIIKSNHIPESLNPERSKKAPIRRVLIYNHYQNIHHSLILLSSC